MKDHISKYRIIFDIGIHDKITFSFIFISQKIYFHILRFSLFLLLCEIKAKHT